MTGRGQTDTATPPAAGSDTAPLCDPATLRGLCAGDCRRRLHYGRPRRTGSAACDQGHPRHDAHGMCSGCNWAQARSKPRAEPPPPLPVIAGRYCLHDEGECDCGEVR